MATRKKKEDEIITAGLAQVVETAEINEKDIIPEEEAKKLKENEIQDVKAEKIIIQPKAKVGDIVYVSKEADADLEGFKLFPQYKKYTYTVEAYDADTDVYTLRRLNLSLRLKGEFILRPDERHDSSLVRRQF